MDRLQYKNVFFKSFVIYASFFLCMLVLMLPGYFRAYSEVRERTLETTGMAIENGLNQLDDAMYAASTNAASLYSNPDIYSLFSLSTPLEPQDTGKVISALRSFTLASDKLPLMKCVGLYMRNDTLLFSNRWFERAQDAWGNFISCDACGSFDEWAAFLLRNHEAYNIIPMNLSLNNRAAQQSLVLAFSLPLDSFSDKCFFFVVYDQQTIAGLLLSHPYSDACRLSLRTASGQTILGTGSEIAGQSLEITRQSARFALSATIEIDTKILNREMRYFRRTIYGLICLSLLIGTALTVAYTHRSSAPLVRILNTTQQIQSDIGINEDRNASQNTLEYVETFIDNLGSELRLSREKQAEQLMLLRESVFDRLLRADPWQKRLYVRAKECFPHFPVRCVMMLIKILHVSTMDTSVLVPIQTSIMACLNDTLPADSLTHSMADATLHLMVVLVPCGEKSNRDTCSALISAVINSVTGADLQFVISTPFEGMENLSGVFNHLKHLLHVVGENGERIIYTDDTSQNTEKVAFQLGEGFVECLTTGSADDALIILNRDIARIKRAAYSNENDVQELFYVYRNMLRTVSLNMCDPNHDVISLPVYKADLTIDEISESLKASCLDICDCISAKHRSNEMSYEQNIINYIDQNL